MRTKDPNMLELPTLEDKTLIYTYTEKQIKTKNGDIFILVGTFCNNLKEDTNF